MFPELGGDEKMEFLIHYCLLMIYLFIRVWKYQPDAHTLSIYVSSLKWIRAQKLSFRKIVDFVYHMLSANR